MFLCLFKSMKNIIKDVIPILYSLGYIIMISLASFIHSFMFCNGSNQSFERKFSFISYSLNRNFL